MKRIAFVLLLFSFSYTAFAQSLETKKVYLIQRANPHPPTIDGKMDDPVWQRLPAGTDFVQHQPEEGKPPTYQTYFKLAYDDKNIYVLIRAIDLEPEKIVRRMARRDEGDDADMVGILFDSYHDQRTAFGFGVNAAGVKVDQMFTNDGSNEDKSWDPVWEVAVSVDDSGWTAEMRIPFSQLRYGKKKEQVWGLQVYRQFYRRQELSLWQYVPRDASGFVHLFGELRGLIGLTSPRRIEILPYAVSKLETGPAEEGNPFRTGHSTGFNGGLDGKIGVTSDLTLDLTVNPDFGQVEADPSVVNLTAFETFFEEKRPFFIEGRNILNFPLAMGDGDFARETLFYSRRIGRRPHYYPDLASEEYARVPDNTTILGAFKLTGKTKTGWSIGALEALTAREVAQIEGPAGKREETVEPLTNYFVGRLQKDFQQGNTIIGGMLTATNRRIRDDHLNFLNRSAYTGGLDFLQQWKDKTYFLNTRIFFSRITGHPDALLEVQTSPIHYFQRPDADYLALDSSRTELFGHGGTVAFGKGGGGHWRFAVGGLWRSPGLELNDLGYLRRADQIMQFVWIGYRWWEPTGIIRQFSLNANQWQGWNFGKERLFRGGNVNGFLQFTNYWGFNAGINREGEALSVSELRGGPALKTPGGWRFWLNGFSDERQPLTFGLGLFGYRSDDRISRSQAVNVNFTWRVTNTLNLRLEPSYSWNVSNLQYVTTEEWENEKRYLFGRIDQNTFALEFRLNFSLTPNLSIQYYGQPFVSAVKYSHFKKITRPRAKRYEDRFHEFSEAEIRYDEANEEYLIDETGNGLTDYSFGKPDFNFREFLSNLVIRWEYRPGSTLYLVWSQNRRGIEGFGDFDWGRDLPGIFDSASDNVFLIKLNYWFFL